MPKRRFTARQNRVIRNTRRAVGEVHRLTDQGRAFGRALKRNLRTPGRGRQERERIRTGVRAIRKTTTAKEAKGVRRVLNNASRRASSGGRRKFTQPMRIKGRGARFR